ncbi:MAG: co-chaperone GroES [Candidatus Sericytochromatia bacterium]|nr:co-chaperone GroES [Candidatus Tanganyikabacteria bacterium]MEB3205162.1 co-chaperone GroES [Candidatus Sericytochromatia bacterium]MEB3237924.1 co-chaperone GroES [Candidatus Sericytochromatia bacterium]
MTTATMSKIRPLGDRVVVKVLKQEQTSGGIYLPDTAQEKPQMGEVIAVGPGKMDDDGDRLPMDVKTGERVIFAKYSGTEVKLDGAEYLLLAEKDILGIIE